MNQQRFRERLFFLLVSSRMVVTLAPIRLAPHTGIDLDGISQFGIAEINLNLLALKVRLTLRFYSCDKYL